MKNIRLSITLLLTLFLVLEIGAVNSEKKATHSAEVEAILTEYDISDVNAFLELTPNKIKEKTGKNLKLREIIALKAAQKQVKKATGKGGYTPKSQVVALILVILVGLLGIMPIAV